MKYVTLEVLILIAAVIMAILLYGWRLVLKIFQVIQSNNATRINNQKADKFKMNDNDALYYEWYYDYK